MPELPEIETIKRQLSGKITAKKIQAVEILDDKLYGYLSTDTLEKLTGREVKKISRRAKVLILELDRGLLVAFHLKMSGQIIFANQFLQTFPNKHTRAIFKFTDHTRLYFQDTRRFGWIKVFPAVKLETALFKDPLGPEPLEKNFTVEYLKAVLAGSSRAVKMAIMDQKVLAGLGNIYASEALFLSGVRPQRPANSLEDKEIERLYQAIKKVLFKAIEHKGSSRDRYRDIYGEKGKYQLHFLVYNRSGQKCRRCQSKIKRIVLGGRSSFFCLNCQK